MDFTKYIIEAKDKSKKRKFVQAMEMIFNFANVDFNNPLNRLNLEVSLPKGKGKKTKVGIFAGDELLAEAKKTNQLVISKQDIQGYSKEKRKARRLANECSFFLCQTDLMASVGKELGQILAPRGKMPKPVPPTAKLEPTIKRLESVVIIKTKGKFLPTAQCPIGTEEMSDQDLVENAMEVFKSIKEKLPNKEGNIKSIYFKTSMGPCIKAELEWQRKKEKQ